MKLEHSHSEEDIAQRLAGEPRASYLRDWVYGGIDGAVTTFAVAAGVEGANLSSGIVLILGCANLLADGFSMAAANYSGTKTEREEFDRLFDIEKRHIALVPDGEREEIRQAFARKGFSGADLEQIVATISSNEVGWARTMVLEEYGLAPVLRSPLAAGLNTFASFALFGAIPLIPYLFGCGFVWSAVATVIAFFAIGSVKSLVAPLTVDVGPRNAVDRQRRGDSRLCGRGAVGSSLEIARRNQQCSSNRSSGLSSSCSTAWASSSAPASIRSSERRPGSPATISG